MQFLTVQARALRSKHLSAPSPHNEVKAVMNISLWPGGGPARAAGNCAQGSGYRAMR
jgi:hypothetical protein